MQARTTASSFDISPRCKHKLSNPAEPRLWRETVMLAVAGAALILVMARPAFDAFFIGENFAYLGQYRSQGSNLLQAAFSTITGTFFRPVLCWATLPWYWLLPPDPLAYHLRNFAFSILNIVLLHRVMLRLVPSPRARAISLLLFAGSKVHMTTIGYINIFDSILMLMLVLLSVLFFMRYMNSGRTRDYVLGLVGATLAIFSKDYGLAVVAVILALGALPQFRRRRGDLLRFIGPLLVMSLVYLVVRYSIAGLPPDSNPTYSPQLSFHVTLRKLAILSSGFWNLSFINKGATGESGLGSWIEQGAFGGGVRAVSVDAAIFVILSSLLVYTLVVGRRAGKMLIFPLALSAYFVPTLLTRNEQIYYNYESFAGIALLVGVCLAHAGKRPLRWWVVVLLIVVANGAFSNYRSLYFWQQAGERVKQIRQPVIEAHRGEPVESIHFVTSNVKFWHWALMAHSHGPLVPELMGLPGLKVAVMNPDEFRLADIKPDDFHLVFDVDAGFSSWNRHSQEAWQTGGVDERRNTTHFWKLKNAKAPRHSAGFNGP